MKKVVKFGAVVALVAGVGYLAYRGIRALTEKEDCCGCCCGEDCHCEGHDHAEHHCTCGEGECTCNEKVEEVAVEEVPAVEEVVAEEAATEENTESQAE